MSAHPTVLFLYTELAPYVLTCMGALAEEHGIDVHVVHWPVNKEAPFQLEAGKGVTLHDRSGLDDEQLLALLDRVAPMAVFASGWVDKGYLGACRTARVRGIRTVMCFDTAWRGTWRQRANTIASRMWMQRTFSHAWVTGALQAEYASRLGFAKERMRTGFYSAATDGFLRIGTRLMNERKSVWPHRLLCVARYIPTKGQQLLCDAFAELCNEGGAGDWELDLVGTGELYNTVCSSPSGTHPRIHHLGFKQVGEMEAVVNHAGAFVLPSTYEPWGVVVHEHACLGLPLLLSSAVGAGERFLKDGENGLLFQAGSR
ncbi:MAG TPA: glycosyltransferase family 4 protein, partial [Flavobacteriales bacterium]|nr:glycosyltransferase family 4 protein [Flavobacteriales bacterium]